MIHHHKPDLKQFEDEAWGEYVRDYKGAPMTWKGAVMFAVAAVVAYIFFIGLFTLLGGIK